MLPIITTVGVGGAEGTDAHKMLATVLN